MEFHQKKHESLLQSSAILEIIYTLMIACLHFKILKQFINMCMFETFLIKDHDVCTLYKSH